MEEHPRPNSNSPPNIEFNNISPQPAGPSDSKEEKEDVSNNNDTTAQEPSMDELMRIHVTCSICAGVFLKPIHLSCGHDFCQPCLRKWKKKCAICRQSIDLEVTSSNKGLESL